MKFKFLLFLIVFFSRNVAVYSQFSGFEPDINSFVLFEALANFWRHCDIVYVDGAEVKDVDLQFDIKYNYCEVSVYGKSGVKMCGYSIENTVVMKLDGTFSTDDGAQKATVLSILNKDNAELMYFAYLSVGGESVAFIWPKEKTYYGF